MTALISMVHKWLYETDGTGSVVRVLLFDFRKAFDLIDHTILVDNKFFIEQTTESKVES